MKIRMKWCKQQRIKLIPNDNGRKKVAEIQEIMKKIQEKIIKVKNVRSEKFLEIILWILEIL